MARQRKPATNPDLEAAVRASADDAPRLAYADWFEANGDPDRADLIRVQVRLDTALPDDPEYDELTRRLRELRDVEKRCLAHLPELEGVRWQMHRGSPSRVIFASYQAFEKHQAEVFAAAPVEAVRFETLRAVAKLAASPGLAQVRRLDLSRVLLRDADAAALAASPHLANVTHLNLGGTRLTDTGLAAIATSPHVSRVVSLDLWQAHGREDGFADAGVEVMARSGSLRNVVVLNLGSARVGDRGLHALLAAPGWRKLTWLDLTHTRIGPEALAPLAEGRTLSKLRGLLLGAARIGAAGVTYLARARQMNRLSYLDLRGCEVGDAGVVALAGAAHLKRLRHLDLVNNHVGVEGAAALAASPHLKSLSYLELASNLVGNAGARVLGASHTLTGLRHLNLYNNAVDDALNEAVCARFQHDDPSRLPAELLAEPPKPAPLPPPPPRELPQGPRDEHGLLTAIADAPDETLPRLVYADWLEENGDLERAELLRIACEDARPGLPSARWRELRDRAKPLAERVTRRWLAPVRKAGAQVCFPEGLPQALVSMRTFLSRKFQEAVKDWFRPDRVGELTIDGTTRDWSKVAGCPLLAGVGHLTLWESRLDATGLRALLSSPHLTGLHTLEFDGGAFRRTSVGELARATSLPRLRRLRLKVQFFLESDLRTLAAWPQLAGLRGLDLSECFLDGQELHALLSSPHLTGLTHLRLGQNRLGDTGAVSLAGCSGLANLVHLDLRRNELTDRGAAALAGSPHLAKLTTLVWSKAGLTEEGRAALHGRFGERLVLLVLR